MTATEQAALVASFAGRRVLVVGDIMLDRYLAGDTSRIAQEAPVPVVAVSDVTEHPGAAGNVAANAAAMGASVCLVGLLGDDDDGARLRSMLRTAGVTLHAVPAPRTLAKTRVTANGQVLLRFDEGTRVEPGDEAISELSEALRNAWSDCEVVIISDYNYGAVPDRLLSAIAILQTQQPRPLAVDARDLPRFRPLRPSVVKPDFGQAWSMLGQGGGTPEPRASAIEAGAGCLLEATGAEIVCVTLDRDGAVILSRNSPPERVPASSPTVAYTNGAGDTFLAAFALSLASGATESVAGAVSAAAASVAVRSPGTKVCSAFELANELAPAAAESLTGPGLAAFVSTARAAGRRIVFTNGVFDVLHRGHVEYLEQAASLGDVMVVAVNDDDSVRRLKGPERPLNNVTDRMAVLRALSCVDAVISFHEDTPDRLIRLVRPDVYVKGGDYHRETLRETAIVEAFGGEVVIAGYVPGRSTTELIARAQRERAPRLAIAGTNGRTRRDRP
jgi:rfaE bifunctional protein kinase chain/domain/rfaE bifunctional protein nucleotidyltransferase chain/domain